MRGVQATKNEKAFCVLSVFASVLSVLFIISLIWKGSEIDSPIYLMWFAIFFPLWMVARQKKKTAYAYILLRMNRQKNNTDKDCAFRECLGKTVLVSVLTGHCTFCERHKGMFTEVCNGWMKLTKTSKKGAAKIMIIPLKAVAGISVL